MWITLRVKEAPERGNFFAPDGASCLRRPILFCLARKEWGEKRRWRTESRLRAEKAFCFCVPFTDSASRKERPSGGPQNFCCLKFCCGKYLCLQNRKVFDLNLCRAFRFCPFLLRSLYWLRKRNEPSKKDQRSENPARQRYSRSNGLFFHIFSAKTEKIWPAERRMRLHKLHRALGASEMGLRSKDTPLRCSIRAYY